MYLTSLQVPSPFEEGMGRGFDFPMNNFKKNSFIVAGICCFLLIPQLLQAQQAVSGQITDASDANPIPNVAIYIAGTTIGTTSDENGKYSITVPVQGIFEIIVSHVGYLPVSHNIDLPNSFHQINVALESVEISEVTIEARSNYSRGDVNLFWRKLLGERPSKMEWKFSTPKNFTFTETPKIF